MAAEAINKHFQQHTRSKSPDNIAAVTGDFVKCKPFHSKKSNIYVHEFLNVKQNTANCESFQNELHRHLYIHETGHNRQYNKSDRIKSKSFQDNYITDPRGSKIPVHSYSNPKAQEVLKNKNTIAKLEESYWANWRPNNRSETVKPRKLSKAHYRVIRKRPPATEPTDSDLSDDEEEDSPRFTKEVVTEPDIKITSDVTNTENSNEIEVKEAKAKKSEEIQVVPEDLSQKDESLPAAKESENEEDKLIKNEEGDEVSPLKHTDSLILNAKRQSEDKPRYQQPRCIRLFRKPVVSGSIATFTRGGSYPLKPAIKKEKSATRGNIRLGKPGSPIMIQTNKGNRGIL